MCICGKIVVYELELKSILGRGVIMEVFQNTSESDEKPEIKRQQCSQK